MSERQYANIRTDLHPEILHHIDPSRLIDDLKIEPSSLTSAYVTQAPLAFYYGELAARAEAQYAKAKSDLAVVEAVIAKSLRAIYAARGDKVAESRLEKEVPLDPRYQDAQWKLRDAKYVQELTAAVVRAFDDRRWMLQIQGKSEQVAMQGAMRMSAAPPAH